jgi:hypothetical protein
MRKTFLTIVLRAAKPEDKSAAFNMNRELIVELHLVNKAIRCLLRIDPALSHRPAIRDTLEALGLHRRRLVRHNRPILLAARKCR